MALNDREYMRFSSSAPEMSGRKMIWILIIINAVAYIFLNRQYFALTLVNGRLPLYNLYQIVTAGFMHGDFGHILFNMWGLWLFGGMISRHLNGKKMLILYLAGVICGNLLYILFNLNTFGEIRLLGASGAVCAFMAAAATLEPEQRLMVIFMPFTPVKTTTLVLCYTPMEIIFELSGGSNSIAHLAHLGGFVSGYITMRIFFGRALPWDPFRTLFRKLKNSNPKPTADYRKTQETSCSSSKSGDDSRVTQRELDELLDKLSNHGINSLSQYELERLKKARRQMRGEE